MGGLTRLTDARQTRAFGCDRLGCHGGETEPCRRQVMREQHSNLPG